MNAEEQLRLQSVALATIANAVVITDCRGSILWVNAAFSQMTGYALSEVNGANLRVLKSGVHPPAFYEELWRTILGGAVWRGEFTNRRKDGTLYFGEQTITPIRDTDGAITHFVAVMNDITRRKLSEQRLKLQHDVAMALAAADALPHARENVLGTVARGLEADFAEWWTVDRADSVLRRTAYWHAPGVDFGDFVAAAQELTFKRGEGLPGQVWASGLPGSVADVTREAGCRRRELATRLGFRAWIGFPIRLRHEIVGIIGLFSFTEERTDERRLSTLEPIGAQMGQFIERQQLAEQFRQAQKMEAVGTLAGGIAHDFNNIIGAMLGYTHLARLDLPAGRPLVGHLQAIETAAHRASALVRQIMAFSRQQGVERKSLQLALVVAEALKLLRATIPTTIDFEISLDRDLPAVLADPTQIHQVVINLCTNAWHAMRDGPGQLIVRLEDCVIDVAMTLGDPALRAGNYVRLSVADTGCGMPPEISRRIFEPFFTTKAPGEGTGLGLAVVHGIVQSHDGLIRVYSQPGQGTLFHVYFPVAAGEMDEVKEDAVEIPLGHNERVLLVDDEEVLVIMGRHMLERLGYNVETMTNPVQALDRVRSAAADFDLVITDLAMPGMSGTSFAEQLLAVRPELPIILMTGYSPTLTVASVRAMGIREMLLKPFSAATLGITVSRALASNRGPNPA